MVKIFTEFCGHKSVSFKRGHETAETLHLFRLLSQKKHSLIFTEATALPTKYLVQMKDASYVQYTSNYAKL
jgi:hypothetical protein